MVECLRWVVNSGGCSRSSPPFGRLREEGIRYRAIGRVYTCAAWRIDAAVIASGYGATGAVAFASTRTLGDRAYEERRPAACPTSERTQPMGKTKDIYDNLVVTG
jgi:hypothetical protein